MRASSSSARSSSHQLPTMLPVIPLRARVLFPGTVLELTVAAGAPLQLLRRLFGAVTAAPALLPGGDARSILSSSVIAFVPVRPKVRPGKRQRQAAAVEETGAVRPRLYGDGEEPSPPPAREDVVGDGADHDASGAGALDAVEDDDPDAEAVFDTADQHDADTVVAAEDDRLKPVAPHELFDVGCAGKIIRAERIIAGRKSAYHLVVEGIMRVSVDEFVQRSPFLIASVTPAPDRPILHDNSRLSSLSISLKATARKLLNLVEELQLPNAVVSNMKTIIDRTSAGLLADLLVSMVNSTYQEKLDVLGMRDLEQRLTRAIEILSKQIQILKVSSKIHNAVQGDIGKKQREMYLRKQLSAIKNELGENNQEDDDESDILKKLEAARLSPDADKVAKRELRRLRRIPSMMPEYQVIRTYLDWLCDLPWNKRSDAVADVDRAKKQLDDDHYGLEQVKKRIVEFLAILKLKGGLHGPIIALIGPPGCGKTSLGRSVAAALGRNFHRISLGGVRDEAEIRGHRRTYVGAMPGLIIQALKRCGTKNPVILLDEIDKVGSMNYHGDPSAALLEVLDPEQNCTFTDHYLNIPFDLSEVLFIATANTADTISAPLLDRMEMIGIPGYTFPEKLRIASRHLLPKQARLHGLVPGENIVVPEEVINRIAEGYTREAGVRNLEREIAAVCRAKAVEYADCCEKGDKEQYNRELTVDNLEEYLGTEKYDDEVRARAAVPGVVTGLVWTPLGSGGILFIEATRMPGKGKLKLTGTLGNVIKESAQLALSWVSSNAYRLRLADSTATDLLLSLDVHVHVPAGAVRKDGPSAGVALVTALVSLFSNTPVDPAVAMTGEITLRGLVLPVGGIKEKVIAAHRAGVRKVILPDRCQKDLKEVPVEVVHDLQFVFVKNIWEVLIDVFPSWDHLGQSGKDAMGDPRQSPSDPPPAAYAPVQQLQSEYAEDLRRLAVSTWSRL